MKIWTWNIKQFLGPNKKLPMQYIVYQNIVDQISELVNDSKADIIVLQEFIESNCGNFLDQISNKYRYILPTMPKLRYREIFKHDQPRNPCTVHEKQKVSNDYTVPNKTHMVTIILVSNKDEMKDFQLVNPDSNNERFIWKKGFRWIEIKEKNNDLSILGVHIPDSKYYQKESECYWENLDWYSNKRKDNSKHKSVVIGDMNVFDEGTKSKEYFNKLTKHVGGREPLLYDAWWMMNEGNKNKSTFENGKRIDYILLSEVLKSNVRWVNCDDSVISRQTSDHAILSVEIDINKFDK